MPFLPVDAAVVVEVGPCIDNSDFKTLETAIAYDAAGMSVDLIENSGTAITKTDLTLTTSGANDWTHKGNGVYEIEITAAQNNTEGTLRVVGVCTGVLPFESPVYTVVPTAVYNSLVLGTDKLAVDAQEISSDSTAADNLELITENAKGADHKILLSTDAQDLSASLDVNAKAISADTTAADNLELLTENALGADNKILISTDEQDLSGTLHADMAAVSDDTAAADDLELFIEALGTDDKVLISTDPQDLSGTFDVNTKTITTDAVDADALKADAATEIADAISTEGVATAVWALETRALTDKDGFSLAATGLDTIPTTQPSGVASTFREMVVQTWRRLFKKSTLTASAFKCYKDNGSVGTTQTVSDDGATQEMGDSS